MKKLLFTVFVIALALYAHAPTDITLSFDIETKILEVDMEHPVRGEGHYIQEIIVELNGEKIISQKISVQEDSQRQTAIYKITNAKEGDEIEVTGDCNRFGKKKAKITVGK